MKILQPPGWPRPKGYSNGISASGRLVVTGGIVGWNEREEFPHKDMAGQARVTFENIAAVLASCGLEHHAKRFEDEGYTLEKALDALASGENALLSDLRDLKLPLGHCRKLINHLR